MDPKRLTIGRRIRLHRLYNAAVYRVDLPRGPVFVSGPTSEIWRRPLPDDDDAALFQFAIPQRPKPVRAAIITACNPGSRLCAPVFNRAAHRRLAAWVARRGYFSVPAAGLDPNGAWPDEPGLCIFGCPRAVARDLAEAFNQAAFVWIEKDRGASVVFT